MPLHIIAAEFIVFLTEKKENEFVGLHTSSTVIQIELNTNDTDRTSPEVTLYERWTLIYAP